MEIQDLNIISDFEAGMSCLQDPSLFSRVFSISSINQLLQVHSLWKWGALILALLATFTALITRIKLLILRFGKILDSSVPPIENLVDDSDSDEDDSSSSASSDDDVYSRSTSFRDRDQIDEDSPVAGSCFFLRRRPSWAGDRFSWSDLASGKSVVKLWDSLGLGFDFEEDSSDESVVSIWDLNRDQKMSSFTGGRGQIPAVSTSSPAVIFSAGSNENDNFMIGAYDSRVGSQTPAMYAEWPLRRPRGKEAVDVGFGGVEKVYVRDDVTGERTVGDLRKVRSPLENVTQSDGDTWWDADGVIGSDD